jgi:hypothetical protein
MPPLSVDSAGVLNYGRERDRERGRGLRIFSYNP